MSLHDFATKIQSAWRGYITRKDYQLALDEYKKICNQCDIDYRIEPETRDTTISTINADPYQEEKPKEPEIKPFTKLELLKTREELIRDLQFIRRCMKQRIELLSSDK